MLGLCIAWQLGTTCIIQLQSGAKEFSSRRSKIFVIWEYAIGARQIKKTASEEAAF